MEILKLPLGQIGANCYILYDKVAEACIVIDPGDEPDTVIRRLENMGLIPAYILLTHGHPDHVGGVVGVKRAFPDAPVMIHEADSRNLHLRPRLHQQTADFEVAKPDRFLTDGELIECGGIVLEVIHTPGHSPGGVCLYAREEDVLFAGDTLFRDTVGRSDFPGGNLPDLEHSIREILYKLPPDTVVYPGHSAETTIGDEMQHNRYIRAEG